MDRQRHQDNCTEVSPYGTAGGPRHDQCSNKWVPHPNTGSQGHTETGRNPLIFSSFFLLVKPLNGYLTAVFLVKWWSVSPNENKAYGVVEFFTCCLDRCVHRKHLPFLQGKKIIKRIHSQQPSPSSPPGLGRSAPPKGKPLHDPLCYPFYHSTPIAGRK